jgi:glycerate-2-kinase
MANTVIFNGVEYKNSTAVKAYMRKRVMEVCVTALKEEFGEELVKEVGSNEWGVVVGQISDEGCAIDAVATLKPTVKEWADRKTAKKVYERYDLEDNAQAYELEVKEKEEERLKKEEEKALKEYEKQQKKEQERIEKEKKKAEKEEK